MAAPTLNEAILPVFRSSAATRIDSSAVQMLANPAFGMCFFIYVLSTALQAELNLAWSSEMLFECPSYCNSPRQNAI